jgi:hypothetical protein
VFLYTPEGVHSIRCVHLYRLYPMDMRNKGNTVSNKLECPVNILIYDRTSTRFEFLVPYRDFFLLNTKSLDSDEEQTVIVQDV